MLLLATTTEAVKLQDGVDKSASQDPVPTVVTSTTAPTYQAELIQSEMNSILQDLDDIEMAAALLSRRDGEDGPTWEDEALAMAVLRGAGQPEGAFWVAGDKKEVASGQQGKGQVQAEFLANETSVDIVDQIMRDIDENFDGKITVPEFSKFLKKELAKKRNEIITKKKQVDGEYQNQIQSLQKQAKELN